MTDKQPSIPPTPSTTDRVIHREGLHAYSVGPIDFWNMLAMHEADALAVVARGEIPDIEAIQEMLDFRDAARDAFTELDWEGDCRGEEGAPRFFAVPADGFIAIGYVLKQDNNGCTFVACQVPLPHLEP